jgi:hypothetical protein
MKSTVKPPEESIVAVSSDVIGLLALFGAAFLFLLFTLFAFARFDLYPDLDQGLSVHLIASAILALLSYIYRQKISKVTFQAESFSVYGLLQCRKTYNYEDVVYYAQKYRKEENRGRKTRWTEFHVHLHHDEFFLIQSDDFKQYDYIKSRLSQYGEHQHLPTPSVKTPFLIWSCRWLSMICLFNIVFGCAAHDEVDGKEADLQQISGLITKAENNISRNRFKGITLQLADYPNFTFRADQEDFSVNIESIGEALSTGQPLKMLIRKSEYEKKLSKTQRPTFGDKYSRYSQIAVFGINDVKAKIPVYEDPHTNPLLRALLFGLVLLFCVWSWQ